MGPNHDSRKSTIKRLWTLRVRDRLDYPVRFVLLSLSLSLSIFSLSIVCPLLPIRPSSPLLFFFSPSSPPLAGSREALCIWILNFNCAFQVQPPPFCFPRPPLRLPSPWLLFPPRLFPFQSSSFLLRLFRDKDTGATDNAMSCAASEKRVYENRIG